MIENERLKAFDFALEIGLINQENQGEFSFTCSIRPLEFKMKTIEHQNEEENEEDFFYRNGSELELESMLLPNYADKFNDEEVPESSEYAEVTLHHEEIDGSGHHRIVVKKSSLCWLLRPDPRKLSSDRLRRVQAKTSKSKDKEKKNDIVKRFKTNHIIKRKKPVKHFINEKF